MVISFAGLHGVWGENQGGVLIWLCIEKEVVCMNSEISRERSILQCIVLFTSGSMGFGGWFAKAGGQEMYNS